MGPLQGRGRRRHPVPHAARRRHAGVLHARLRPQREGAVQRAAGRLRRTTWIGWRASSRRRARSCPQPVVDSEAEAPRSASSPTARRTGRSTRAAISCARRPTSRRRYLRLRAYPFTPTLDEFIDAPRPRLRRRAEPRRADAAADEAGARRRSAVAKLRSVLHYSGLPIDARSVTDDVLAQEGFEVAKKDVHVAASRGGGMTGGE